MCLWMSRVSTSKCSASFFVSVGKSVFDSRKVLRRPEEAGPPLGRHPEPVLPKGRGQPEMRLVEAERVQGHAASFDRDRRRPSGQVVGPGPIHGRNKQAPAENLASCAEPPVP